MQTPYVAIDCFHSLVGGKSTHGTKHIVHEAITRAPTSFGGLLDNVIQKLLC